MQDTEGHVNVEWCNKREVVKYLFSYVTKGPDRVGSECLMESPPRVQSGEVMKYLFKYVMKGSKKVGYECMLESSPRVRSGEAALPMVDAPDSTPPPSMTALAEETSTKNAASTG